ncbi:MAG TPA: Gfo/Idh/MocA family oxidoreductase [Vicinamibacterales bacterium]|nr:Gfo/Idh/MocA family oxidoreductase [Vicinamibacterales bacterium]
MTGPYRVVVVGMGKRGLHHAAAFKANARFQLVGIASRDGQRLAAAASKLGEMRTSTDARALAGELKPDVFCFCTPPGVRLPLVEIGIQSGAKLIAFEKPVALTSAEGMAIKQRLETARVKAVVSHQHRYGDHYQKVKSIVASGAIGTIHCVYGTATGWATHLLSHLVDYTSWFNEYSPAAWAMGQAAGRRKLVDSHASPDYISGVVHFSNGVRGVYDCGAGAPDVPDVPYWWRKCRIGAQGSDGFAEVHTGGGWRAVTRDGVQSGPGSMDYDHDMPPYVDQMADWLDDDARLHPARFERAYHGLEIVSALYRSAVEGGQIVLPLTSGADELEGLKRRIPDREVLMTLAESGKEYS